MLASSFDDWSMLVLAADTQTLDSGMVPKLESPVISADGIFSEVVELIISSMTSLKMPSADITGDYNFGTILESKVCVSEVNTIIDQLSKIEASMTKQQPGKTILTSQRKMVDVPTLAKRCNIPLDRAKNTVLATTQRGVRNMTNPSIMRRFPNNDHMMRYKILPHPLFTDTLLAGTASQRGQNFAQVFATSYGWCCTIPMKKK